MAKDTQPVELTGSNAKEPFSGSSTITKTFSQTMRGFFISNDDSSLSLTFAINGYTFTVLPGETMREAFEPFTQVTVTTTVPFRAWGLG